MRVMDRKKAFDLAKKQFEGGDIKTGYQTDINQDPYLTHSTKEEWCCFLKKMKQCYPKAYNSFRNCKGGELKEFFNSRWQKQMPPKMASYGSSSRMIYELSKDIQDFCFEKPLKICISANNKNTEAEASLDGYLELKDKTIYVEAKCHEFYSSRKTEFKHKYLELYEYLKKKTGSCLNYITNNSNKTICFLWNREPITQFDLKQILCHLLGIAKQSILEKGKQSPVLLYLVYNPSELLDKSEFLNQIDKQRFKESITQCWETEKSEASKPDVKLLYKFIVYFLFDKKGVGNNYSDELKEAISNNFQFQFCDQFEYRSNPFFKEYK